MIQSDTLIPGIRRTSLLTLFSLGLMLIGTFAVTKLISSNSQSRSKAAEQNMQIQSDSCGYLPPTNGDDRSGAGCQLTTKPEVSFECASCITAHQSGFREWWDSTGNAACNNVQIVSNWRQMEPDGKRNFYHGHTTEPGGPCNCFCANELANPDTDYGKVPTATTTPPSRSPSPTVSPHIPPPSPTFINIPSPTNLPPPTGIFYPTVKKTQPPVPSFTPTPGIKKGNTVSNEIKKIQSAFENTSKKGVALGKATAEKGKNWLVDVITNFLRETSF